MINNIDEISGRWRQVIPKENRHFDLWIRPGEISLLTEVKTSDSSIIWEIQGDISIRKDEHKTFLSFDEGNEVEVFAFMPRYDSLILDIPDKGRVDLKKQGA